MSEIELPPKYYHENFKYLLSFVKGKYEEILIQKEWSFLRKYYSLPEDAQCLFIRLVNRKGIFFKTNSLKYVEIDDIPENLVILKERGFVEGVDYKKHTLYLNELLYITTKTDLVRIFSLNAIKTAKKEEIINHISEHFTTDEAIEKISAALDIIKVNFEAEVSFLMFLFFGNRSMDMTEFVLRDLGLMQYYKTGEDDLVARFSSRKEAEDKWLIADQFLILEEIKNKVEPAAIYDWYANFHDLHTDLSESVIPVYQKFQIAIGRHLERKKMYELAIEVYKDAKIPPARERIARCLVKTKNPEEAKRVCEAILEEPYNIDEQYFAEYFIQTVSGKKSRKKTTDFLKQADEITIAEAYRNDVEAGSLLYFMEAGFDGAFSENFTWRALFGLTFWDIIFDPSLMSFHHPFQRRPSDLYLPDFYIKRHVQLQARLDRFADSEDWIAFLWEYFKENEGVANPFVLWEPQIWDMVRVLVSHISLDVLKEIMMLIAENMVENSRGFPDLLLWTDDSYELIEIKSPNDTLSNQQLFWLETFERLGINSRVLRVKFDPTKKPLF